MGTREVMVACVALVLWPAGPLIAGPWEDGLAAYNRGDYVPSVRIIRPLATQGNAKAQALLGKMYHRGEGVGRNLSRAYLWLSIAAAGGDSGAAEDLRVLRRSMSPDERSQAEQMVKTCESAQLSGCPY